ncbi:flagellar hook-length control protein FliK [Granulosicoccaceae sp. 1_MG-2023]|nr:flagellar hook-length control protein FliK [Granulosicoccaceae sp. 1_MG-2023]
MISPSTEKTAGNPLLTALSGGTNPADAEGAGGFSVLFGGIAQLTDESGGSSLEVSDQKLMEIVPLAAEPEDADATLSGAMAETLPAASPGAVLVPLHTPAETTAVPTVTLTAQTAPAAQADAMADAQTASAAQPDDMADAQTAALAQIPTQISEQPLSVQNTQPTPVPLRRLSEIRQEVDGGRVVLRPRVSDSAESGMTGAVSTTEAKPGVDGESAVPVQASEMAWRGNDLNIAADTADTSVAASTTPVMQSSAAVLSAAMETTAAASVTPASVAGASETVSSSVLPSQSPLPSAMAPLTASRLSAVRLSETPAITDPAAQVLSVETGLQSGNSTDGGDDNSALFSLTQRSAEAAATQSLPAATVTARATQEGVSDAAPDAEALLSAQAPEEAEAQAQAQSGDEQENQTRQAQQAAADSRLARSTAVPAQAFQSVAAETAGLVNAAHFSAPRSEAAVTSVDPSLLMPGESQSGSAARESGASMPAATLSLRDSGWDKGLGANVAFMLREDIKSASIRVNPEELGALDIQLEADQDRLQVSISAAHAVTRDTLEAALPRLREQFASLGFERVEVSVQEQNQNDNSGSLLAGDQEGGGDSPAANGKQNAYSADQGEVSVRMTRADSLLDTYA